MAEHAYPLWHTLRILLLAKLRWILPEIHSNEHYLRLKSADGLSWCDRGCELSSNGVKGGRCAQFYLLVWVAGCELSWLGFVDGGK